MIARDLDDGMTILIRQQDHADLAAQFAAHWGTSDFVRSDRFESVVRAAACHDDHFRDVEALLPIDVAHGRPFGHRTTPFSAAHLEALQRNVAWLEERDRYAAVLVSMHHTGLPQNRYGVIRAWVNGVDHSPPKRAIRPEVSAFIEKMERAQKAILAETDGEIASDDKRLWFDYRLLQLFDLLSLYLCCDGYVDGELSSVSLGPIPLGPGSDRGADIRIAPQGDGSLRFDPYPFDQASFEVTLMTRVAPRLVGYPEADCRSAYSRATRKSATWTITP